MDKNVIRVNRTGIKVAPGDARRMETASMSTPAVENGHGLAQAREGYIAESEPLGSVPVPDTDGQASKAPAALQGERLETLIDRLGQRLAFERSGTRLYEALLVKVESAPDTVLSIPSEQIRKFRDQEAEHFNLVADVLERLGADPSAQTPSADVTGVTSLGLMQVLDDPRTTLPQCLEAILIAELADNDAWTLLIELTREVGLEDVAESFERALEAEKIHLHEIRHWVQEAVLGEST